jgi:hypothetical protein
MTQCCRDDGETGAEREFPVDGVDTATHSDTIYSYINNTIDYRYTW